jgi:hypothetical protein
MPSAVATGPFRATPSPALKMLHDGTRLHAAAHG